MKRIYCEPNFDLLELATDAIATSVGAEAEDGVENERTDGEKNELPFRPF